MRAYFGSGGENEPCDSLWEEHHREKGQPTPTPDGGFQPGAFEEQHRGHCDWNKIDVGIAGAGDTETWRGQVMESLRGHRQNLRFYSERRREPLIGSEERSGIL